jgi:hypothetical protein
VRRLSVALERTRPVRTRFGLPGNLELWFGLDASLRSLRQNGRAETKRPKAQGSAKLGAARIVDLHAQIYVEATHHGLCHDLSDQSSREKVFGKRNITLERMTKLPSVFFASLRLCVRNVFSLEAQRRKEDTKRVLRRVDRYD